MSVWMLIRYLSKGGQIFCQAELSKLILFWHNMEYLLVYESISSAPGMHMLKLSKTWTIFYYMLLFEEHYSWQVSLSCSTSCEIWLFNYSYVSIFHVSYFNFLVNKFLLFLAVYGTGSAIIKNIYLLIYFLKYSFAVFENQFWTFSRFSKI